MLSPSSEEEKERGGNILSAFPFRNLALRSEAEVVSSLLAADLQEENFDTSTLLGDSETVDPLWRERETKELRVAIPNGRGTMEAKSGRPANSQAAEQTMADLIGILEVELRGSKDGLVSFPSSLPELKDGD